MVLPSSGISGEEFTFGVEYRDFDGEKCSPCQLWIDLDQNDTYGENEKFDMSLVDSTTDKEISLVEWDAQDWKEWRRFVLKKRIESNSLNTQFAYRFVFKDGKDEPASTTIYAQEQKVIVRPTLVVRVDKTSYEAVSGGSFRVDVHVYMEQNLTKQIVFKWDQVDRMALPKGVTLRERKVLVRRANRDYDVAELTLYFDVLRDVASGTHQLVFPRMSFEVKIPSTDRKKPDQSKQEPLTIPNIELVVVPIRVSTPLVSATALTIGSSFNYHFSVSLNADFKDKEALIAGLRAQTLLPFRVLKHGVHVGEQSGRSTEIAVNYVLSIEDGISGQFQIPSFSVGSITLPPQPIIMFPIEPPGKVPASAKEMEQLTSRIKMLAVPIMPQNVAYMEDSPKYLAIAGSVTLFVFAVVFWGIRRKAKEKEAAKNNEERAMSNLTRAYQDAEESFALSKNHRHHAEMYHALRALVLARHKRTDIEEGVLARELQELLAVTDPDIEKLATLEEEYFTTS